MQASISLLGVLSWICNCFTQKDIKITCISYFKVIVKVSNILDFALEQPKQQVQNEIVICEGKEIN